MNEKTAKENERGISVLQFLKDHGINTDMRIHKEMPVIQCWTRSKKYEGCL